MSRHLTAVLSAAAIAAALGLSGCSPDGHDASPEETATPPTAAQLTSTGRTGSSEAPQTTPLPSSKALSAVLYRLADPAVPGAQKLNLVEGAASDNAGVFDQFASALVNGGYAPVKFDVRDIGWSDRDPADVLADVNVSSTNSRGPRFSFPMEFKPYQAGWQLSARTAEVLLAFRTEPAAPPATPGR
jgi:hypothetical protein